MTCQTFVDAACILSSYIQPDQIIRKYYSCRTAVEMECEKIILEQMKFCFNNKVAYSFLPKKLHNKVGYGNTDVLVSIPAHITEVELGITVFEMDNGNFSVSIRANGFWDSSLLASALGGGEHKSSAGAKVSRYNIIELIDLIKQLVEALYQP